jgi:hypothetical protein
MNRPPGKGGAHFVAFGFAFLFFIQLVLIIAPVRRLSERRFDFRHLYASAYMVRTGHGKEIYDYDEEKKYQDRLVGRGPETFFFNHPAFETLFFVPLSFVSCDVAYWLMFLLNLGVIVVCFITMRPRMDSLRAIWVFLPGALFLCFLPFGRTLVQGQDSIILTILLLSAAFALERQRDLLAGFLLALGLFKFQFVLPIVALFLIWKKWRVGAGFAMGTVVVVALSVGVAGINGLQQYFAQLLEMSAHLSASGNNAYMVYPSEMANLRGLMYGLTEHSLGHSVAQLLTLAASLSLFWWVARQKATITLAILFAVLVSYHCLMHDLSILAIPLFLVAGRSPGQLRAAALAYASPSLAVAFNIPFWLVSLPILLCLFSATGKAEDAMPGTSVNPAQVSLPV